MNTEKRSRGSKGKIEAYRCVQENCSKTKERNCDACVGKETDVIEKKSYLTLLDNPLRSTKSKEVIYVTTSSGLHHNLEMECVPEIVVERKKPKEKLAVSVVTERRIEKSVPSCSSNERVLNCITNSDGCRNLPTNRETLSEINELERMMSVFEEDVVNDLSRDILHDQCEITSEIKCHADLSFSGETSDRDKLTNSYIQTDNHSSDQNIKFCVIPSLSEKSEQFKIPGIINSVNSFSKSLIDIPYFDESDYSGSDSDMLHSCELHSKNENARKHSETNVNSECDAQKVSNRCGAVTVTFGFYDNAIKSVGVSKHEFKDNCENESTENILSTSETTEVVSQDNVPSICGSLSTKSVLNPVECKAFEMCSDNQWELLDENSLKLYDGREVALQSYVIRNSNFAVTCNTVALLDDIENAESQLSPEDRELLQPILPMPAEEEKHLREFLQTLNLADSPDIRPENKTIYPINKNINEETPSSKRTKTKQQLENYFVSSFQNPRFLDIILEETAENVENTENRIITDVLADNNKNSNGNHGWEEVVYNAETNEIMSLQDWERSQGSVWEDAVYFSQSQDTIEETPSLAVMDEIKYEDESQSDCTYTQSRCCERNHDVEIIFLEDSDSSNSNRHARESDINNEQNENGRNLDKIFDSVHEIECKYEVIGTSNCRNANVENNESSPSRNLDFSSSVQRSEINECPYSSWFAEHPNVKRGFSLLHHNQLDDETLRCDFKNSITQAMDNNIMNMVNGTKPLRISNQRNSVNFGELENIGNGFVPTECTQRKDKNVSVRRISCYNNVENKTDKQKGVLVETKSFDIKESLNLHSRNNSTSSENTSCDTAVYTPVKSSTVLTSMTKEVKCNDENNKEIIGRDDESVTDNIIKMTCEQTCTSNNCKSARTNSVELYSPRSLRELALIQVVALPFGFDVLMCLGISDICSSYKNFLSKCHVPQLRVSSSSGCSSNNDGHSRLTSEESSHFAKDKFPPPIPSAPQISRVINQEWVGMPTKVDPKLLVCFSPSQRKTFQGQYVVPTPEEAESLLDLHRKFIERRGYHELKTPLSHTQITSKSPHVREIASENLTLNQNVELVEKDRVENVRKCINNKTATRGVLDRSITSNLNDETSNIEAGNVLTGVKKEDISVTSDSYNLSNKNIKSESDVEEESRLLAIIRETSPLEERTKLKYEHCASVSILQFPQSYQQSENSIQDIHEQELKIFSQGRNDFKHSLDSTDVDGIMLMPQTCRRGKCIHDIVNKGKDVNVCSHRSANFPSCSENEKQLNIITSSEFENHQDSSIKSKNSVNVKDRDFETCYRGMQSNDNNQSNDKNRLKAKLLSEWMSLARGYSCANISRNGKENNINFAKNKSQRKTNVPERSMHIPTCLSDQFFKSKVSQSQNFSEDTPSAHISLRNNLANGKMPNKHDRLRELILQRRYSLPENVLHRQHEFKGNYNCHSVSGQKTPDCRSEKESELPFQATKEIQDLSSETRKNYIYQRQTSLPTDKNAESYSKESRNFRNAGNNVTAHAKQRYFEANEYNISKRGDIAIFQSDIENSHGKCIKPPRPLSLPPESLVTNGEIFRQRMYAEYMNKVAELEERRKQKVILISAVPNIDCQDPSMPPKKELAELETAENPMNVITTSQLEEEFMDRVRKRMTKLGIKYEDADHVPNSSSNADKNVNQLPKHLQEFLSLGADGDEDASCNNDGVWSPLNSAGPEPIEETKKQTVIKKDDDPAPVIWTPKSAGASPVLERKEYRQVNFQSPTLSRKNKSVTIALESEEQTKNFAADDVDSIVPPWKHEHSRDDSVVSFGSTLSTTSDKSVIYTGNTERRIVQSQSTPTFGLSSPSVTSNVKLPRVQSPTITLLQKAREGQLPRGALYLDHKMNAKEQEDKSSCVNDILYTVKKEYESDTDGEVRKKIIELSPKKYDGIGPVTNEGIPLVLRSNVKDESQAKWYKRMYDSLHRGGRHGHYTYTSGRGYVSEPEPIGYDSDIGYSSKYATLDRRRMKNKENDFTTSTLPHPRYGTYSNAVKYNTDVYRNQPGRIEDYEPGRSSVSEKETKQWWDEVMDIFDGQEMTDRKVTPLSPSGKSFMAQALKESGYESDSTLVFKRRDDNIQNLSPAEQKMMYKSIQKGGDVPLHGLRKLAPERPKESPHKYVESEVTIHYKSPIRSEAKELLSEEELARRQAEAMQRIYQEERRRKYLQELQDMNSRRHTDNFTPSQKSPIPLNRYDDFLGDFNKPKPKERTPEPKLVARALYNFIGQSLRELSFRRGDIIFVRKQVDKNWYEGEHNAMIGLFPINYVEIIPYDGIRTIPKRPTEGQARAKFNFIAQTDLELSLVKGELLVLTRRVDDNWYEGRIGNRKGIFPVSYVEVLVAPGERPITPAMQGKPVTSPASHSVLVNGVGVKQLHYPGTGYFNQTKSMPSYTSPYGTLPRQGQITSKQNVARVNETLHIDTHSDPVPYRALYNYKPQNDDELELIEGDTVYVMEKCDDGWYVGSSLRSGGFGTFPGNYVERL